MKPPRRGRRLTAGEVRLWDAIAKLVTPLPGRAAPIPEAVPEVPAPTATMPALTAPILKPTAPPVAKKPRARKHPPKPAPEPPHRSPPRPIRRRPSVTPRAPGSNAPRRSACAGGGSPSRHGSTCTGWCRPRRMPRSPASCSGRGPPGTPMCWSSPEGRPGLLGGLRRARRAPPQRAALAAGRGTARDRAGLRGGGPPSRRQRRALRAIAAPLRSVKPRESTPLRRRPIPPISESRRTRRREQRETCRSFPRSRPCGGGWSPRWSARASAASPCAGPTCASPSRSASPPGWRAAP